MPCGVKSWSSRLNCTRRGTGARAAATSGQSPRLANPGAKNIQVLLSTGRSSSAGCVVIIPITPAPAISSQVACSRAARQPPPDNPTHAIGPDTTSRRDCRYRPHATRAPQEVALPPPPVAAATPRSAVANRPRDLLASHTVVRPVPPLLRHERLAVAAEAE